MDTAKAGSIFSYATDIHINYEVRGAGITLLLLHGFGASLESWRDILPLLEQRYKLILVDMKGFGLSSKPDDGTYSIREQASIIMALIRYLDLKDLVLIGHSYGGSVALATYLELVSGKLSNPIRSLILLDAPGYPQRLPLFIKVLQTPVINHLLLALLPARARAAYILNQVFYDKSKVTADRINRYARFFDLPGSHRAMIDSARQLIPENSALTARIGEIAVPTLIIWGAHDPLIYLWQAHRLHDVIQGSRLTVLARCGHVPQEERPEDTAQLFMEFIS